jgi:hypothetical protein
MSEKKFPGEGHRLGGRNLRPEKSEEKQQSSPPPMTLDNFVAPPADAQRFPGRGHRLGRGGDSGGLGPTYEERASSALDDFFADDSPPPPPTGPFTAFSGVGRFAGSGDVAPPYVPPAPTGMTTYGTFDSPAAQSTSNTGRSGHRNFTTLADLEPRQEQRVVRAFGNVHGFGSSSSPSTTRATSSMPTTGGHRLGGTSNVSRLTGKPMP